PQREEAMLLLRIVFFGPHEHADAPYAVALLRPGRERPCRRAAEERDELAPPDHSITSVASASSIGGTLILSALAVLRLLTNSNLVGCRIGRSPAFSRLRIRPVYSPIT